MVLHELRISDYDLESYHDNPVTKKLYLIVDVEHRMYECPVCGALYRVHQYERKLFAYQVRDL